MAGAWRSVAAHVQPTIDRHTGAIRKSFLLAKSGDVMVTASRRAQTQRVLKTAPPTRTDTPPSHGRPAEMSRSESSQRPGGVYRNKIIQEKRCLAQAAPVRRASKAMLVESGRVSMPA